MSLVESAIVWTHRGEPPAPISAQPIVGRQSVTAGLVVLLAMLVPLLVSCSGSGSPAPGASTIRPVPTLPDSRSSAAIDPLAQAKQTLQDQAAALMRGDEQGWLAAVGSDPAVQGQFRQRFRALRALGVLEFGYEPVLRRRPAANEEFMVSVQSTYCFTRAACTRVTPITGVGRPKVADGFWFAARDGRYVITKLDKPDPNVGTHRQPMPWQVSDLSVVKGRRVTVAGPASLTARIEQTVVEADAAAKVTDAYGTAFGHQTPSYRIYLAGDTDWKTWYGGIASKWADGVAATLYEGLQVDIVLKNSAIPDNRALRELVQHEMGHVVTLEGSTEGGGPNWLEEGIAEYISGRPAAVSLAGVRRARFTGIEVERPGNDASDSAQYAFYGTGHLAVACFVDRYGKPRMTDFVRQALREGASLDAASRKSFGRPFAEVSKECTSWIRGRL